MSQRLLSCHFSKKADIGLFDVPDNIISDQQQGLISVDLQAQSLIADLFYYSLPNKFVFLDLTMPGIKEGAEEDGGSLLNICLKKPNYSNVNNAVLSKDIISTLQKIYQLDNNATMAAAVEPDDKTLCSIRYLMDTVTAPLSMLASKYNPGDDEVQIRVELLAHLMERRNGYSGYKPAPKLH